MAFLTKARLDSLVADTYKSIGLSDAVYMSKAVKSQRLASRSEYDVFLSHSFLDRDVISKIHLFLTEKIGLSVFVDWIENPELDRSAVTPTTAKTLREAMDISRSTVYAVSANAAGSKWMPWELGYSDAKHGRVAVLPIADSETTAASYKNQEFVALYPYIDVTTSEGGAATMWVNDPQNSKKYASLRSWKNDGNLPQH